LEQVRDALCVAITWCNGRSRGQPEAPAATLTAASQPEAVTEQGEKEVVKPADEIVGRLLRLVGDGDAIKILSLARDESKSANDRMCAIIEMDRRFDGYDSVKWGELLAVTPEAVRQTACWINRKQRREQR
jgi:hypothetical protein